MRLLVVEDEEPKREAILAFVSTSFAWSSVTTAHSVRSAISSIRTQLPALLLLDMSLPTFDIAPGEPGGRPQGEGGVEVLRYLEMSETILPTIVVTGYDAFKKPGGQRIGYERLSEELRLDYPGIFRGLVHFDPIQGIWGEQLRALIASSLIGARLEGPHSR
jgi:CheY-like chemotaxis protein